MRELSPETSRDEYSGKEQHVPQRARGRPRTCVSCGLAVSREASNSQGNPVSLVQPLLHVRDEKTELQRGFVSLFVGFAAGLVTRLITGAAPHFTGGIRRYVVYV